MSQPRYQVFVSSTFRDLQVERQCALDAILELNHFPAGMEIFPAADATPWELIERIIGDSDYYVLIIGQTTRDVAIRGPFPHISTHVENPIRCRAEGEDPRRRRMADVVSEVHSIFVRLNATPRVLATLSSPRRPLPFSFRGQPVSRAGIPFVRRPDLWCEIPRFHVPQKSDLPRTLGKLTRGPGPYSTQISSNAQAKTQ